MSGDEPMISDTLGLRAGASQSTLALQMNDPWFWHKLVPGMTLRHRRPPSKAADVDPVQLARARQRLIVDGFATVRAGIVPRPAILEGIDRILASGLPPVFVFMYDEPWQHLARLRTLFSAILGGPYLL